jgi:hypothetical protein
VEIQTEKEKQKIIIMGEVETQTDDVNFAESE